MLQHLPKNDQNNQQWEISAEPGKICSELGFDAVDFENKIIKKKKYFTGLTTLKYFIDGETIKNKIFAKFMKWLS